METLAIRTRSVHLTEVERRIRAEYPVVKDVRALAEDLGYAVSTLRRMASSLEVYRPRFSTRHPPEVRAKISLAAKRRWQAWRGM